MMKLKAENLHFSVRLIAMIMCCVMACSIIPYVNTHAASKGTVTVNTVKKLQKALKKTDTATVVLKISKKTSLKIPASCSNTKVSLVIDAPEASIINRALLGSITINNAGSYTEHTEKGTNTITVNDNDSTITVYKKSGIKKLLLAGKNSSITIGAGASIASLVCKKKSAKVTLTLSKKSNINAVLSKKTSLTIKGDTSAKVEVSSKAASSMVRSYVPLTLKASKKTVLKLEKGSEGSIIDRSKEDITVKITNNTKSVPEMYVAGKKSGKDTGKDTVEDTGKDETAESEKNKDDDKTGDEKNNSEKNDLIEFFNDDGVYCSKYGSGTFSEYDGYFYRVQEAYGYYEEFKDLVIIEKYDPSFKLVEHKSIKVDDSMYYSNYYAGKKYNFLVFWKPNPKESDDALVIRVVKYDKNWNRLGQADVYGANTLGGGFNSFAEKGDYLFMHGAHNMFERTSNDGLNHQSNMTFSLNMETMEFAYEGYLFQKGYVSHSFHQNILVDDIGQIILLDLGDAAPRSLYLQFFTEEEGKLTDNSGPLDRGFVIPHRTKENIGNAETWSQSMLGKYLGYHDLHVQKFAPAKSEKMSDVNKTGCSVGGIAETDQGYVIAYTYDGFGGQRDVPTRSSMYISFVSKKLNDYAGRMKGSRIYYDPDGDVGAVSPRIVSIGKDKGGYIFWREDTGNQKKTVYVRYSVDGTISDFRSFDGIISEDAFYSNGKIYWYVNGFDSIGFTKKSEVRLPVVYSLDIKTNRITAAFLNGESIDIIRTDSISKTPSEYVLRSDVSAYPEYDKAGEITSVTYRDEKGKDYAFLKYQYDANGKKTGGELTGGKYTDIYFNKYIFSYSSWPGAVYDRVRIEDNKGFYELVFNNKGGIVSYFEHSEDAAGDDPDDPAFYYRDVREWRYELDDAGRWIHMVKSNNTEGFENSALYSWKEQDDYYYEYYDGNRVKTVTRKGETLENNKTLQQTDAYGEYDQNGYPIRLSAREVWENYVSRDDVITLEKDSSGYIVRRIITDSNNKTKTVYYYHPGDYEAKGIASYYKRDYTTEIGDDESYTETYDRENDKEPDTSAIDAQMTWFDYDEKTVIDGSVQYTKNDPHTGTVTEVTISPEHAKQIRISTAGQGTRLEKYSSIDSQIPYSVAEYTYYDDGRTRTEYTAEGSTERTVDYDAGSYELCEYYDDQRNVLKHKRDEINNSSGSYQWNVENTDRWFDQNGRLEREEIYRSNSNEEQNISRDYNADGTPAAGSETIVYTTSGGKESTTHIFDNSGNLTSETSYSYEILADGRSQMTQKTEKYYDVSGNNTFWRTTEYDGTVDVRYTDYDQYGSPMYIFERSSVYESYRQVWPVESPNSGSDQGTQQPGQTTSEEQNTQSGENSQEEAEDEPIQVIFVP